MDLIFDSDNRYGRVTSPYHADLCKKLGDRYKGTAYVVSSGMNAISTLFRVILDKCGFNNTDRPYHLVYSDELYCDLPRLFNYFHEVNGIILHPVHITETAKIQSLLTSLKNERVIFYFETCSNPHGMIFEFNTIKALKKENDELLVIIDNTWASSAILNPLDWDADFVISSLTKYYSNSKSLGGVVISRHPLIAEVEKYIRFHGLHVSPYNCKIILDNIDTLDDRMSKAYSVMLELFEHLSADSRFKDIVHPSFEHHSSHEQYQKYFNKGIGPSVFTMRIKGNDKVMKRLRSEFTHIKYKTSFGGYDTRYDPWHKGTSGGYTCCRISVGYNSTSEKIYDDFIRALPKEVKLLPAK
ncbi:Cys/Met metabolism PLP-dependent enzyme [uncultured virus]|nr:Cys/Met metabolism PLP-dependent enzyme [uncultured virus]